MRYMPGKLFRDPRGGRGGGADRPEDPGTRGASRALPDSTAARSDSSTQAASRHGTKFPIW